VLTVPLPPDKVTTPAGVPPQSVLPAPQTVPVPVPVLSEINFTLAPPVFVMLEFKMTFLKAVKVKLFALAQLMAELTVIFPVPAPLVPVLVVVTVIALLAKALVSVVTLIVEVADPELGVNILLRLV